MSEKILEIKDERLSFFTPAGEVKALNGVSFSMNQGDVLGIVTLRDMMEALVGEVPDEDEEAET